MFPGAIKQWFCAKRRSAHVWRNRECELCAYGFQAPLTLARQGLLLPHSFLHVLQAGLKESMTGVAQGLQETILASVSHLIDTKLSAQTGETSGVIKPTKRRRPSPYKRNSNNIGEASPSKSRGNTANCLHVSHPCYPGWSAWLINIW